MFRSAILRERVRVVVEDVLEAVDIVLSEPLEAPPTPHPHRRPLQPRRARRPGTVAPAPAECRSPVRRVRPAGAPAPSDRSAR